jgi:tetratricopeptide (TPR) repeat protein
VGENEFRDILDLQVRLLGRDHQDSLSTRHNLAHILAANGKMDQAIAQFQETIERKTRTLGPADLLTLRSRRALLFYLIKDGRAKEAKQQLDSLALLDARLWSIDHPANFSLRYSAAAIRIIEGDVSKLDLELKDLLKREILVLGESHSRTLDTRMALADLYEKQGKNIKARAQLQIVLSHRRAFLGKDHRIVKAMEDKLTSLTLNRK